MATVITPRIGTAKRDPYSGRRLPGEYNEYGFPLGSTDPGRKPHDWTAFDAAFPQAPVPEATEQRKPAKRSQPVVQQNPTQGAASSIIGAAANSAPAPVGENTNAEDDGFPTPSNTVRQPYAYTESVQTAKGTRVMPRTPTADESLTRKFGADWNNFQPEKYGLDPKTSTLADQRRILALRNPATTQVGTRVADPRDAVTEGPIQQGSVFQRNDGYKDIYLAGKRIGTNSPTDNRLNGETLPPVPAQFRDFPSPSPAVAQASFPAPAAVPQPKQPPVAASQPPATPATPVAQPPAPAVPPQKPQPVGSAGAQAGLATRQAIGNTLNKAGAAVQTGANNFLDFGASLLTGVQPPDKWTPTPDAPPSRVSVDGVAIPGWNDAQSPAPSNVAPGISMRAPTFAEQADLSGFPSPTKKPDEEDDLTALSRQGKTRLDKQSQGWN